MLSKRTTWWVAIPVLLVLLAGAALAACGPQELDEGKYVDGEWQWPKTMVISSSGGSGLAKYVSWGAILEQDTGMSVRVVPEESFVQRYRSVATQSALLADGGKRALGNIIEAVEGHATRELGPFPMRVVWIHSIANSGVMVRADSYLETIYDIRKGTRWAVWSMTPTVLKVPKAILDWVQVPHDDVIWVNVGSYDGAVRAVAEGRADIMFCFPVGAAIHEASSNPWGIRFLDLNSDLDPEGAARFRANDPAYGFGPILVGPPAARGVWGTVGASFEITHADSSPDLIYNFIKWLDENLDRYKDQFDTNPHMSFDVMVREIEKTMVPLHEGTIRYLKEKGVWTAAHDRRQAVNIEVQDAWIKAWPEALARADERGIRVDPTNREWIKLWTDYQKELRLPKIGLHDSLTEDYIDFYTFDD